MIVRRIYSKQIGLVSTNNIDTTLRKIAANNNTKVVDGKVVLYRDGMKVEYTKA